MQSIIFMFKICNSEFLGHTKPKLVYLRFRKIFILFLVKNADLGFIKQINIIIGCSSRVNSHNDLFYKKKVLQGVLNMNIEDDTYIFGL